MSEPEFGRRSVRGAAPVQNVTPGRFLHWQVQQKAAVRPGSRRSSTSCCSRTQGHTVGDELTAPTIGEVADSLHLRHHSTVELVDRAEQAGLVHRSMDEADRLVVRLALTSKGQRLLDRLTASHLDELRRLAPTVTRLARGLDPESV